MNMLDSVICTLTFLDTAGEEKHRLVVATGRYCFTRCECPGRLEPLVFVLIAES